MLSLIVAYDKNKSIGQENTIPWRLKRDMLRVKELTTNQTIIMGRKTLDSIGRALSRVRILFILFGKARQIGRAHV